MTVFICSDEGVVILKEVVRPETCELGRCDWSGRHVTNCKRYLPTLLHKTDELEVLLVKNLKYSMIIANCHQKTGFFEHLHSSEISEQYLIFFVLVGHLIIPNEIGIKIILTCLHNNLNMKCHFQKNPSYETYPEAVLYLNAGMLK